MGRIIDFAKIFPILIFLGIILNSFLNRFRFCDFGSPKFDVYSFVRRAVIDWGAACILFYTPSVFFELLFYLFGGFFIGDIFCKLGDCFGSYEKFFFGIAFLFVMSLCVVLYESYNLEFLKKKIRSMNGGLLIRINNTEKINSLEHILRESRELIVDVRMNRSLDAWLSTLLRRKNIIHPISILDKNGDVNISLVKDCLNILNYDREYFDWSIKGKKSLRPLPPLLPLPPLPPL